MTVRLYMFEIGRLSIGAFLGTVGQLQGRGYEVRATLLHKGWLSSWYSVRWEGSPEEVRTVNNVFARLKEEVSA